MTCRQMTESAYSINEREDQHCAEIFPLNLVVRLDAEPDRNDSTTQSTCLYKPNRIQRCFSQLDRKTDCYRNGVFLVFGKVLLSIRDRIDTLDSKLIRIVGRESEGHPLDKYRIRPPFTVAVCGTQTRMPKGFKLMSNQIHALSAPTDNMAGEVRKNRSYRMLSTADEITRKRGELWITVAKDKGIER